MGSNKTNYSTGFKEKAVELSYHRDNMKELADELGIESLVYINGVQKQQIIKYQNLSNQHLI